MSNKNVPRVSEMTGRPPQDDTRTARDWQRARADLREATSRFAFGTPEAKREWLRKVRSTRSF
jgi:hypothetical protein